MGPSRSWVIKGGNARLKDITEHTHISTVSEKGTQYSVIEVAPKSNVSFHFINRFVNDSTSGAASIRSSVFRVLLSIR